MKLKDIVELTGGRLEDDDTADILKVNIKGAASLEDATGEDISFYINKKHSAALSVTKAKAVFVREKVESANKIFQIVVPNPLIAFARAVEKLYSLNETPKGILDGAYIYEDSSFGKDVTIHPNAFIDKGVKIGDYTVIHPGVYVGKNCTIGSNCTIYPNVTVQENSLIGNSVTIHPNAVIGADGFKYEFDGQKHVKIPHIGHVEIADNVEIGAGVTIDRALTGKTTVGEGTKIDNLVQIAHNVKIGKHCLIISQVGIAGSSELGSFVTLAGQVGISDHVSIESQTIIGAQSGVTKDLKKDVYFGTPAIPHMKQKRAILHFHQLDETAKKLKELEKKLNGLMKQKES